MNANTTAARIGRGNAVHAVLISGETLVGAACGADNPFGVQGFRKTEDAVTCKRCLKTAYAAPAPAELTWESYLPQGL